MQRNERSEEHVYSIGQLSAATGVTVRTLRYYDELGILSPTTIAPTGYRYYDATALLRLQQIIALKQFGCSLAEIKQQLDAQSGLSDEQRWRAFLQQQLDDVRAQQAQLHMLEARLQTALNALDMTGTLLPEDIELFVRSLQPEQAAQREAFLSATFSSREAAVLRALPQLSTADERTCRWVSLVRELRSLMHGPPDAPAAQNLVPELLACAAAFFDGDEALIDKYWELVRPAPGEPPKIYGLDASLVSFIDAIVTVWDAHTKDDEA